MPSPEYVAVTGYVPMASDVEVRQLTTGNVATHSVVPPDAKVTVPVAPVGSPDSESVSAVPKPTLAGEADSVKVTLALVIVTVEVVVCGAKFESPE